MADGKAGEASGRGPAAVSRPAGKDSRTAQAGQAVRQLPVGPTSVLATSVLAAAGIRAGVQRGPHERTARVAHRVRSAVRRAVRTAAGRAPGVNARSAAVLRATPRGPPAPQATQGERDVAVRARRTVARVVRQHRATKGRETGGTLVTKARVTAARHVPVARVSAVLHGLAVGMAPAPQLRETGPRLAVQARAVAASRGRRVPMRATPDRAVTTARRATRRLAVGVQTG